MRELQDMLRVQARLHRKQGANALGDLFEYAGKEIESLSEQLAEAKERAERCEKIFSEAPDLTFGDVQRMFSDELNKFAIEKKIEALEKYANMCGILRTEPSTKSLQEHIEQLRKEQSND